VEDYIEIKGDRVNNLNNINVKIPRNKFVVITGVSGSGKSSLAFETLYAEGQRRYVESLSSYARQFLGRMGKPECDFINGIPPAIAIQQKVISRNPRSTVGTSTEIYEYLRLLFTRIGRTFSPISGQEVKKNTTEDAIDVMMSFSTGTKFMVTTKLRIPEERAVEKHLKMLLQEGFSRIWYKGKDLRLEEVLSDASMLGKLEETYKTHTEDIDLPLLVVDRMSVGDSKDNISRLVDSTETAFYEGNGECTLIFLPSGQRFDLSTRFEADGIHFEEPSDNMFSFNNPMGACPECEGFGNVIGIDEHLVIPDTNLSVYDGCVACWHGQKLSEWNQYFIRRAEKFKFPIFEPYYKLDQQQKDWLWHGLPGNEKLPKIERVSIDDFFDMVKENQYKIQYRVLMSRYRGKSVCPKCHGTRLKKESNYVKICGRSITDLVQMPIGQLKKWFDEIQLTEHEKSVGKRILTEINNRLQFLLDVGLDYLTLNRASNTLSGGESQRINLTTSIGSSLVGSLYILDEPSIGLHSRDTEKLIKVIRELTDIGNTVIVVEHDEEIMRAADYIIDLGPEAGRLGGDIVFEGDLNSIISGDKNAKKKIAALEKKFPKSHTLKYLDGNDKIEIPSSRRQWNSYIGIHGARMNNLKGIDVKFPLKTLTVVTGVSGSGKSSLIKGILLPALKRNINEVADAPGAYSSIDGDFKSIQHVEYVDQNPIGKSTRSNPATYLKAYDAIRDLFAEQPLAQQMGFTSQYFSFNTEGGRCEECKGSGVIDVEMQFMANLTLTCEACHGKRFKHDVLDVMFHDKNIYDILEMTVSEAMEFFDKYGEKNIVNRLRPLEDVGLGYIKLGQNSSTLSGGENQRVKLAYYIGQEKSEPTMFIFDEPTTGLHFHDISKLLKAFDALLVKGHSIIVIEHNIDVIKCADYIIDLGPEGGDKGGFLVATGTPEEIIQNSKSITGKFLSAKLKD